MKTLSLYDLREDTAKVVRRIMLETYYGRKTRRSSRVKLGSVSPVLINPTMLQTRNKVNDEPLDLRQGNKVKVVDEAQSLMKQAKGEIASEAVDYDVFSALIH